MFISVLQRTATFLKRTIGFFICRFKPMVFTSLAVTVSYSRSIQEMMVGGRYKCIDDDIVNGSFPVRGKGIVRIKLFLLWFDCNDSLKKILYKMNQAGYTPAGLEHLLALGVQHPHLRNKLLITCLNSPLKTSDNHYCVPCLTGDSEYWWLSLHCLEEGCDNNDRLFVALRRS